VPLVGTGMPIIIDDRNCRGSGIMSLHLHIWFLRS